MEQHYLPLPHLPDRVRGRDWMAFCSECRGLWGVGYSNTVVSHPPAQMMSQLSCACGVGFLTFHSASHIAGWRGAGGTVIGEICSLKEEDRVLTCTHRPCMTCPPSPPCLYLLPLSPARRASSMFLQPVRHFTQTVLSAYWVLFPQHILHSLESLLKCHLLNKALPGLFILILITHPPWPLSWPYFFILHDTSHHRLYYAFFYLSPPLGCKHHRGRNHIDFVHCSSLSVWDTICDQ